MGVPGFETEPENLVEYPKVHEQEVHDVCDVAHVIAPPVCVTDQRLGVRLHSPALPRMPQGRDQVCQAEVGPGLHVARHDGKPDEALVATDDVGLDAEVVLGLC